MDDLMSALKRHIWIVRVVGIMIIGVIVSIVVLTRDAELNDTTGDIYERFRQAETVDEQLRQMYRLEKKQERYGGVSWTYLEDHYSDYYGLIREPAERLPADLEPDIENAEYTETLPDSLRNAHFLALYNEYSGWFPYLLGDFQVRLPNSMRANTLDEVDAVLLLHYSEDAHHGYVGGSAKDRHYDIYVYERSGKSWQIFGIDVDPPVSGNGTLIGDAISLEDLWNGISGKFY